MKVITNNHYRQTITWHELTAAEQSEFDWDGASESDFFRYRGAVYCLDEFTALIDNTIDGLANKWDGIKHDTFFSGVVVRFNYWDAEQIKVGLALS